MFQLDFGYEFSPRPWHFQKSAVGVARSHGQAPPERGEGPMVTHPPHIKRPYSNDPKCV